MLMSCRTQVFICASLLCAAMPALASVSIGAGAKVDFADAAVDSGCSDLTVSGQAIASTTTFSGIRNVLIDGTFLSGAAKLTVGGDFINSGTFTAGTGQVRIDDVCGGDTTTFAGSTSFYDLLIASNTGKQVVFPAGIAQNVAHAIGLQGAPGKLLRILSNSAGQQALLAVAKSAAQTVRYVDARDNNATVAHMAPGAPSSYNSIDSGDLTNWFGEVVGNPGGPAAPVPAPALGTLAQGILLTILMLGAWLRRSRAF